MRAIRILFFVIYLMTNYAKAQSIDYTRAPNSYIFDIHLAEQNEKGGLLIPVKKAYDVWSSNEYLTNGGVNTPIPNGTQSASLYWEDVIGLIRSVELIGTGETAKIKVMIDNSKGKGNALVAFKVDDEVYWSWHIWVTDDPSDGVVYSQGFETNVDGVRFDPKYMDRNLGALNDHFLGDDWHKSSGLMYQWGRKDPFPTMVYKDFSFYELNGEDIGTIRHKDAADNLNSTEFIDDFMRPFDEIEKNIRFSLRNPLTYINNSDDYPYIESTPNIMGTWFSKQQYRNTTTAWDLWGDNYKGRMSNASSSNATLAKDSKSYELKSPYDPCPNGWRIPSFYGRITTNNNHSPWGRKNSGGNDAANPLYSLLYPDNLNPVLNGIKVYIGLGMDFTNVPDRNLGIMPIAGNNEYYPNVVSPDSEPHTEYQDESADGAFWSATYGQGGARTYRMISDLYKNPYDETSPSNGVFATSSSRPKEGNAVRCMQDPNLYKIGSFETEYVDKEIIDYKDGIDNPNSYLINTGQLIQKIPINKAFSVYNQYLSDHDMLDENDLKANVFWTTNSELIKKIYIEPDPTDSDPKKSNIVVELNPGEIGNAVVSLHNEDISNPAYWSWHIWVPQSEINKITYTTEEVIPANYNFVNITNSRNPPLTTTFMDRNLGALESFPDLGDPEMLNNAAMSGGLHYQWGRKDPIPSFLNPGNTAYTIFKGTNVDLDGEVTYQTMNAASYSSNYSSQYDNYSISAGISVNDSRSIKLSKILKFAAENPLTYLFHNGSGTKDWLSDELGYGQERWGHGGGKSPFDPCPAGWRVPDMTYVFTMYKGSSPWFNGKKLSSQQGNPHFLGSHYGGTPVLNESTTLGWVFTDPLYGVGNYPSTGIRTNGNTIEGITYQTGVWTSAVSMRQQSNALAFRIRGESNGDYRVTSGGSFSPQNGMNVRCSLDEPRYSGEQICPITTWSGGNWSNGAPNLNKKAIIDGAFVLTSDLEACELEVTSNGSLEIPSGFTFNVKGIIINNASAEDFIVSSGANLIQIEEVENIGEITVLRDNQPFRRLDYTLWSSPVSGQQLQAFSPMTLPNRISTYEGELSYVQVPDAETDFLKGKGYMFRAPNNWSTVPMVYHGEFKGMPLNGEIIVSTHVENYTSIGNPYPSNINADLLMMENPGALTLYFWNNMGVAGNNYATYTFVGGTSPGGNVVEPNGIISVGQGFLVASIDSSVKFKNSMRVDDDAIFYKNGEPEKHRIWLDLKNENEFYNQIIIGYISAATNEIDNQIDGRHFGYEGSALYNIINEEKFTIQGRALPFETSDIVKLGFKAEQAGKFNILLTNFDGLFAEGEVIICLKDKHLNVIHNLMESPYSFESASGEFKERFEVIYQKEPTMATENLNSKSVQIYTKNENIVIESKDDKIISVEIYDLSGKEIHSNQNLNTNFYNFKSNTKGVLVVKIQTILNEIISKKVIIK